MPNSEKTNILMVCLGNICRSPLAEGILRKKIHDLNLPAEVSSCGTSAYHISEPADPRTIATARRHGINISSHRARQFQPTDFDRYDLIFAMDRSNYRTLLRYARDSKDEKKVKLIMDMVPHLAGTDVPDPYYSEDDGFEEVYHMLDQACEAIVSQLLLKKKSSTS